MNNITGELLSKIMGGYFKLALPPQRQQPYSDELFSQSSQAIQTGTVVYDFVLAEMHTRADVIGGNGGIVPMLARSADAMFSGLPDLQTLYLD
ncbi:hypothetical protein V2P20_00895 [Methylobacter sp. Wu1]|uniref:hypothetical protein n=1 Tax=Methylobacter sp. Wu1 TaxID=3119359 RepID=UPI002F928B6F